MSHTIIITGPPGIGKTSVARTLAANLDGVCACISGDAFVLAVTPFETNEDRRLFLRECLASFARHAIHHAYDWVVLECVIPCDEFIHDLIEEIDGCAKFSMFSLLASKAAYEKRLKEKLRDYDSSFVDLTECQEWLERIRTLRTPIPVDTSRQTLVETAAELLNAVNQG